MLLSSFTSILTMCSLFAQDVYVIAIQYTRNEDRKLIFRWYCLIDLIYVFLIEWFNLVVNILWQLTTSRLSYAVYITLQTRNSFVTSNLRLFTCKMDGSILFKQIRDPFKEWPQWELFHSLLQTYCLWFASYPFNFCAWSMEKNFPSSR